MGSINGHGQQEEKAFMWEMYEERLDEAWEKSKSNWKEIASFTQL